MPQLYVFSVETRETVAVISGADNAACERVASDRFGDTDYFASTYTPAFGTNDGLIETEDAERIDA